MSEGLEISEIKKTCLERTSRIDYEFYAPENLSILDEFKKHKLVSVSQLTNVSDGNHISISNFFKEKGVPYYRGKDIHNYFIEQANPIYIDESIYNTTNLQRSHLKKGDVLLSIVGTIGGVSLVSSNEKATCSCKLAILRPKKIDGFYLSAFLKSKFGQNQIRKFTRGAVQMGIILEDFDQIYVPVFSDRMQLSIRRIIELAQSKLMNYKQTYCLAEQLLLQEVGLDNFESNTDQINIKSFSDSFKATGRLDAEYYQKKYEQVIKKIGLKKHDKLVNIVDIVKSIEPGSMNYSD